MYFGHVYHNSRTSCSLTAKKNCLLVVIAAVFTNEYTICVPPHPLTVSMVDIHTYKHIMYLCIRMNDSMELKAISDVLLCDCFYFCCYCSLLLFNTYKQEIRKQKTFFLH